MAWISVHEQVIGGKLRTLAKEIGCSQNEALGILVRMWLWAINNADKDGYITGADREDVAEVLSIGLLKKLNAEAVVDALVATNWIDIENGLYIHDWEEWQEHWYKAIEIRKGNAERKRKERTRKRMEKQQSTPDTNEPKYKDNIPNKKKQESTQYPTGFENMWEAYPRKVGKGEAYKKYKARLNDGYDESELLEAVKRYAAKVIREHTEQKYIKHAKTFFSENMPFLDYLPHKEEAKAKTVDNDENPYADWRK